MPKKFISIVIVLICSLTTYAIQIIRGPYLQVVTPHSITIKWRTDSLTNSVIYYGLSPNMLNNTYTNVSLKTDHVVTLNNLQPITYYYYAVANSTAPLSSGPNHFFRTSPLASPNYNQPLHFWAVGDIAKQTTFEDQVREAFLHHKGNTYVDGWIMLGDNAYESGTDAEFQLGFFNYFQEKVLPNIPLIPAVGNHEYANNYLKRQNHDIPYFDIFNFPVNGEAGGLASGRKEYYSIDYGNVHLIQLDSYGWELVNGSYVGMEDTLNSPQINWLKADLQQNILPWVIVSFHHPPYCMGTHQSDIEADLTLIRTNVTPILERYNVDMVLNGHSHCYERSNFMKGHTGPESSFDSTHHIRQLSSGRYDGSPASCPYTKNVNGIQYSDSGTVYAVVGSGSAAPQTPFAEWPHNAMSYSNYLNNGSLLLRIEGNRLDAKWISIDTLQPIKDYFTIVKEVNRYTELHVNPGTLCTLRASWPANQYDWSTGDTLRQIYVTANQDTTYIVSDIHQCLSDTFKIILPLGIIPTDYSKLTLYPNPTQSEIHLGRTIQNVKEYAIADMTGRTVFKGENIAKLTSILLPGCLQNGSYLLHVKVDKQSGYQGKFSIQR